MEMGTSDGSEDADEDLRLDFRRFRGSRSTSVTWTGTRLDVEVEGFKSRLGSGCLSTCDDCNVDANSEAALSAIVDA